MKELIEYIENLTITQGVGAGDKFVILPGQRRFLQRAFKADVSKSALTISRGGGKTTLLAAIGAAAVHGPLAQPRAEVLVVASSFAQARLLFETLKAFLQPMIDESPKDWSIQDNQHHARIEYKPTGASIRAIASDPCRAHGRAPSLAILDEPAQWTPSTSEKMLAAIETSLESVVK